MSQTEVQTKTKEEICEILQVNKNNLRQIESRGKLEERLEHKGYKLISKEKKGRSYVYNVQEINSSKKTYSDVCNNVFHTNLYEEFAEYYLYRMLNLNEPISQKYLGELSGVTRQTVGKWDDTMVDTELLKKDGYWYIAVDYTTDENGDKIPNYRHSCKEEWLQYMENSRFAKSKQRIKMKYISNVINIDEYSALLEEIARREFAIADKFVYRIRKFRNPRETTFRDEMFNLIQDIYPEKELAERVIHFDDMK